MRDLVFLLVIIGFFLLGAGFIRACAHLIERQSLHDLTDPERRS